MWEVFPPCFHKTDEMVWCCAFFGLMDSKSIETNALQC